MANILPYLLLFFLYSCATHLNEEVLVDNSKVVMLGTFHFGTPGLDVVKNDVFDVTKNSSQLYLDTLAKRLSSLRPTAILVECDALETEAINSRLQKYINDRIDLGINEIEQIGFRIAKLANLDHVVCFDERTISWDSQSLFEELKSYPKIKKKFRQAIEEYTEDEKRRHSQLSLKEIFIEYNHPDLERQNRSLYLITNVLGAGSSFAGADASATWWHRNLRMFANIQTQAQKNSRLIVIVGQGHSSLIRGWIKDDPDLEYIDILQFL